MERVELAQDVYKRLFEASESFEPFCPELAYLFPAILNGGAIDISADHPLTVALRELYSSDDPIWLHISYVEPETRSYRVTVEKKAFALGLFDIEATSPEQARERVDALIEKGELGMEDSRITWWKHGFVEDGGDFSTMGDVDYDYPEGQF
jgi:hypothetical protein